MAAELGPKTSQKEFARAVNVDPRTIRNWRKRTKPGDFPKLGRPAHDERAHRVAFWRVGREYLERGRCGWLQIKKHIGDEVPTRLIQQHVRRLKACQRAHQRRRILKCREHVDVLAKNVLWVDDSTRVASTVFGDKVESQVIKDRGPLKTVGIATGNPTNGKDVITLLESLKATRGLPLVFGTDNGPPFKCEDLESYLERNMVIHLKSLPRTPQHNGSAEVNMGELKRCAQLGAAVIASPCAAHTCLVRAALTLNENRIRISKGLKTAAELDEAMDVGYHLVDRGRFYSECSRRIAAVRRSGSKWRAMRMAERDAIFGTLEDYGLVKRYRGGTQAAGKAEIFF